MTSFTRRLTRALAAPRARVSCNDMTWNAGLLGLRSRGRGSRESGAFLLGQLRGRRRFITDFLYYDEVDPNALDTGMIDFNGAYYGRLWSLCRSRNLRVVADVHTHPGAARASITDLANPMVAQPGHVAVIIPNFAQQDFTFCRRVEYGVYEYLGEGQWRDHSDQAHGAFLYIGRWGAP